MEKIQALGFTWVAVDLGGYRMGSMNEALKEQQHTALNHLIFPHTASELFELIINLSPRPIILVAHITFIGKLWVQPKPDIQLASISSASILICPARASLVAATTLNLFDGPSTAGHVFKQLHYRTGILIRGRSHSQQQHKMLFPLVPGRMHEALLRLCGHA